MITTSALRKGWIWPLLCLIMAGLQLIRGAYAEAVIFTALPILLIIDSLGLLSRVPDRDRWLPSRPVLAVIGVAVGIPLTLAPRYSLTLTVIISAAGALALVVAWPGTRSPTLPEPGPALDRGRMAWAVVCLVATGLEVFAYLLSRGSEEARLRHPAVSDLIGPLLDTDPGRLAFAAAWVAGGFALLRRGWRR